MSLLVLAIFLSGTQNLFAQTDSIALQPVTVTGFVPEKFMSGLKVVKIDSAALQTFQFQNITDLLSAYTPIAFNKYGPGQLATAFFRGTSASHTAVLWNGLNINSPTLGQTDFSTIPVAGFDALSVQFGSSASIVGSDAVGGSVLLNSRSPKAGFQIQLGQQVESFHNYQTQFTARYGKMISENWLLTGKTSGYYTGMNNKYPYKSRRNYTVLHSETFQKGLVQDIFLNHKNGQELSAHVWLNSNRLILTPENIAGRELTQTEAYRAMLRYQVKELAIRAAWVRDIIDYAKGDLNKVEHAVTDRLSLRAEKDLNWELPFADSRFSVKAGAEFTHFRALVPGYDKGIVSENRSDIFILNRWQSPRTAVSLNLRQALVTGYDPPFTPSLGAEHLLVATQFYQWKIRGSVARSFRTPTLNERYWDVLGDPDIRPESGWNKELGMEQTFSFPEKNTIDFSVTGYHNRVKDWTYWNPVKNYRVENLQQVLARGIEIQAGWRKTFQVIQTGLSFQYALNRSVQEKAYDAYSADVVGKQLRFVPKHTGYSIAFVQYKNSKLSAHLQGVGKRYITFDNTTYLDEYALLHFIAETTINIRKVYLRVQGQVNNVTNTFYLAPRNAAMPGRSFSVNLIAGFDKNRN